MWPYDVIARSSAKKAMASGALRAVALGHV
jgi:hypothetical protein